ncbi:MAG TPA: DNA repair protein RecO [Candidatus Omnitrophota bacterium]|nr:DNA repair protein RecO [Candidatus Omnitrophota bacterium]HQL40832.1 DNA repair protein RecO [Candidatus Omnitrophota bacterium]
MILKTEGIVLKRFDFRETSRIATFFTRDHGKIKGVLKGIRKDHKKFGSNIDQFSVNDIVYYFHRDAELHLVGQCDLKAFFFKIRQDIKRTLAASYALELVDSIMPMEEKNELIYDLLLRYLHTLEDTDDVSKLVHVFQIKILLLSGFRPYLDSCVVCQAKISPKMHFSMKLGGLICENCYGNDHAATHVSRGTIASLVHIEKGEWKNILRLRLTALTQKELKFILNNFLVYHLERHMKSARFLNHKR